MRTVNVGLIGLGTVGSGVVEILKRHGEQFRTRAGVDLALARCADRDPARAAALGLAPEAFTTDAADIIGDPSIDIVIELIGGTGVARSIVLDALAAGKTRRDRQQGAHGHARPGDHGCRGRHRRRTSCSRLRWAAASRSSARSSTAWSATRSRRSTAS